MDNDNDGGSDGDGESYVTSHDNGVHDDVHDEDIEDPFVEFVENLGFAVHYLVFFGNYYLGSLYNNSLRLNYSILCRYQNEGHVPLKMGICWGIT